jgi:hypothetical protein
MHRGREASSRQHQEAPTVINKPCLCASDRLGRPFARSLSLPPNAFSVSPFLPVSVSVYVLRGALICESLVETHCLAPRAHQHFARANQHIALSWQTSKTQVRMIFGVIFGIPVLQRVALELLLRDSSYLAAVARGR